MKRGTCYRKVCPSVCLSVCLSHLQVSPKRFKISHYTSHHTIEGCFYNFLRPNFPIPNIGVYSNKYVKESPPLSWAKVGSIVCYISETVQNQNKLFHCCCHNNKLLSHRKSHTDFPLIPKLVTLIERHDGRYFALFHRIR